MMESFDIAIIGAGPAGSVSALHLRERGYSVCVIEKSAFPRETVCGEFLSDEVVSGLKELGLDAEFMRLHPNPMETVRLDSDRGLSLQARLGFTAFGIKRGTFDHFLLSAARRAGARIIQPACIDTVTRWNGSYLLHWTDGSGEFTVSARRVIGAYGRYGILDKRLHRTFTAARTHLNGIKIHVDRSLCPGIDTRAIHLFTGSHIYCGVNAVNDGVVTVCLLEQRAAGDDHPRRLLTRLAAENTAFKACFAEGFDVSCQSAPMYGTGNIYFARKDAVVDGIFMVGDSAEVIAPLSGDGIGMAFQSARLLAEVFDEAKSRRLDDHATAALYIRRREGLFRRRLRIARLLQTILLSRVLCSAGMSAAGTFPRLLQACIGLTRT